MSELENSSQQSDHEPMTDQERRFKLTDNISSGSADEEISDSAVEFGVIRDIRPHESRPALTGVYSSNESKQTSPQRNERMRAKNYDGDDEDDGDVCNMLSQSSTTLIVGTVILTVIAVVAAAIAASIVSSKSYTQEPYTGIEDLVAYASRRFDWNATFDDIVAALAPPSSSNRTSLTPRPPEPPTAFLNVSRHGDTVITSIRDPIFTGNKVHRYISPPKGFPVSSLSPMEILQQTASSKLAVANPRFHAYLQKYAERVYQGIEMNRLVNTTHRKLVYGYTGYCGGLGDQTRAMASAFLIALLSDRAFFVEFYHPVDGSKLWMSSYFNWVWPKDIRPTPDKLQTITHLDCEIYTKCSADSFVEIAKRQSKEGHTIVIHGNPQWYADISIDPKYKDKLQEMGLDDAYLDFLQHPINTGVRLRTAQDHNGADTDRVKSYTLPADPANRSPLSTPTEGELSILTKSPLLPALTGTYFDIPSDVYAVGPSDKANALAMARKNRYNYIERQLPESGLQNQEFYVRPDWNHGFYLSTPDATGRRTPNNQFYAKINVNQDYSHWKYTLPVIHPTSPPLDPSREPLAGAVSSMSNLQKKLDTQQLEGVIGTLGPRPRLFGSRGMSDVGLTIQDCGKIRLHFCKHDRQRRVMGYLLMAVFDKNTDLLNNGIKALLGFPPKGMLIDPLKPENIDPNGRFRLPLTVNEAKALVNKVNTELDKQRKVGNPNPNIPPNRNGDFLVPPDPSDPALSLQLSSPSPLSSPPSLPPPVSRMPNIIANPAISAFSMDTSQKVPLICLQIRTGKVPNMPPGHSEPARVNDGKIGAMFEFAVHGLRRYQRERNSLLLARRSQLLEEHHTIIQQHINKVKETVGVNEGWGQDDKIQVRAEDVVTPVNITTIRQYTVYVASDAVHVRDIIKNMCNKDPDCLHAQFMPQTPVHVVKTRETGMDAFLPTMSEFALMSDPGICDWLVYSPSGYGEQPFHQQIIMKGDKWERTRMY